MSGRVPGTAVRGQEALGQLTCGLPEETEKEKPMTNFKSRLMRYGLLSTALAALAVPAAMVGTAVPASAAASCGRTAPDLDSSGWPPQTAGVSANQRSGSSTGCGVTGYADNRDILDFHCYTINDSGTTWTYLRNVSDGTYGWVSDSLLPVVDGVRGSDNWCQF
jgi:hypothetical protein